MPKWQKVTRQNYHPNLYPAHKDYADQVYNYIRGETILKDITELKDEMKKQEELEDEEEEEEDVFTVEEEEAS
jgi:hypothetical protein